MRAKRKQININKILVYITMGAMERPQAHLKRKKKHVVVMFACMNEVNNYGIQRINAHAKQQLYP